ncbi:hypothetical protein MRX96_055828 [Rhipicephalus microplus]
MDMDDAEEAGVEPTVLEEPPVRATTSCAAHDTVGDHSEMFSSGCSSNMINTECDAVSVPTARVTTINDFVLKIKKQLCLLFFRVAEVHKLPHSTAESVFNDFKITFLDIIRTFASVIENNIAMESAGIELRKLLAGEFLEDIFQAASSKYKREQFAKRHLPYVKPEVRDLGAGETFQFVPISGVMRNLMSSENFRDHIELDFSTGAPSPTLHNFRDGCIYKEKLHALLEDGAQYTLFFVLYSDEVEIVNPLGSKRGVHKILVVYFSVVNIHAKYRSQLSSIHVVLVAPYRLVIKHGINVILKPVVDDVSALWMTGFTLWKNSVAVKVRAILVAFSGDNLSMNRLGGFTCSFSRGRPCRFCTSPNSAFNTAFHESDVKVRNLPLHQNHVASAKINRQLGTALYGVKDESPLTDVAYFDVTVQLPPDLMHDVLEGAIPHVLRHILQGLLRSGVIRHSDLDRIRTFVFGAHDKKNKPEEVVKSFLNGQSAYKGTASQKWCLFRFFSLMFADIVPKQNEHWEVYLLLRSIADITFADKIPHDHLAYLQDEIRFFLSSFAALYPGAIIPKLHFLIHYPRLISELGPLKQYWCMRYEAKHQYMKTIAQRNQNFRNICKSIAERHQLLQSFEFSNLEVDRGIQTKRSRQLKLEDLCSYMRKVVSPGIPVWEVGSAEVENLVFKKFDVVILEKQQLPLFGQIRRLYIYCGSLFLLVDVLMTVRFDRHRWSYVVDNTDEQKLVQPFNLPSPQVLDLYFGAELMLRPEIMIVE